jgi:hypothetical protein
MRDPRDEIEGDRPDAPPGLFFSRRGNWFHDGQRIRHERLAGLLSRSVDRDAAGALVVTTGRDTVPFVAEDAPLIVRMLVVDAEGITLHLSDDSSEHLAAAVCIDDAGSVRVPVRGGRFWALLSRGARQGLEPLFIDEGHLALGGRTWDVVVVDQRRWDEPP